MRTFLTNWTKIDLMPAKVEIQFITYQQILEGRKEKVKRLLVHMAQEKNFERVHRAKHVLSRIERATFIIS